MISMKAAKATTGAMIHPLAPWSVVVLTAYLPDALVEDIAVAMGRPRLLATISLIWTSTPESWSA
jgi:hypothetical protein